jgi:hypothetical protein
MRAKIQKVLALQSPDHSPESPPIDAASPHSRFMIHSSHGHIAFSVIRFPIATTARVRRDPIRPTFRFNSSLTTLTKQPKLPT